MALGPFHLLLHWLPTLPDRVSSTRDQPTRLGERACCPLQVTPAELCHAFPVSWEEAEARLAALPRMLIEPDGSFVWVSSSPVERWQVDGQFVGDGGALRLVELRGSCPAAALDNLLDAFGGREQPWVFELVVEGIALDRDQL